MHGSLQKEPFGVVAEKRIGPGAKKIWLSDWRFRAILCLAIMLVLAPSARPQPLLSTEYEIKSVLLYNLAQFVEWPSSAFDTPTSPIVIGVFGENVFGDNLNKVVEGETVQNRKIIVRYYRRGADVQPCHILFITRSESARLESILTQVKGKPVLTVSDIENFAIHAGMVGFVSQRNKVRLRLNPAEIEAGHLKVSSKLLRISELVPK